MKTTKLISFILLFLGWGMMTANAQEGTAALDKAVQKFKNAKGISASFSMAMYNASGDLMGKQNGSIKLSGNKFYWTTNDMTVWYNGQSQWTYVKEIEEVNLTAPTADELAAINPYILITNYKGAFNAKALSSKNSQEAIVELTPKQKGSNLDRVVITLNRSTWIPGSFKVYASDRSYTVITLSKYTPGQNFAANTFVFNAKQYPKADLIDLR